MDYDCKKFWNMANILEKNSIKFPNFVLIQFVLCAWEFFSWKKIIPL